LWDTGLEPNWHGEKTGELTENQLLAGFGSDRLIKELSNFTRVQMSLETPDSGFTESGKLLTEVECLHNSLERIVVGTLRGSTSWTTEQAGEESGMTSFLNSHESDKFSVGGGQTGGLEVLFGEPGKNVVEKVKLNPFLVQTKEDGLVVKVGVDLVNWLGTVGTKTTSWRIWHWLRVVEQTVSNVSCSWVWWQRWNGRTQDNGLKGSGGGWGTTVWAVAGDTSNIAANSWEDWVKSSWDCRSWKTSNRSDRRDSCSVDAWRLIVGVETEWR